MIKCNLAILLAERKLRITKVFKDTGISRTTLTSLSHNESQGIQLDTLNTLCMYLGVTPNDLLTFLPIDYEVHAKHEDCYDVIKVKVREINKSYTFYLKIVSETFLTDTEPHQNVVFNIELLNYGNGDKIKENNVLTIEFFKKLPRSFLPEMQERILEKLCALPDNHLDIFNPIFHWPSELLTS